MADYPKLVNCSFHDIIKACDKLGGCAVSKGGRHVVKITHIKSQKSTVVPNHKPLKKGLVCDFVKTFLQDICGFKEEEIFKVLWC